MATYTITNHDGETTTIHADRFVIDRGAYSFLDSEGVVVAAFNQPSVQHVIRTPAPELPQADLRPFLASLQRSVEEAIAAVYGADKTVS